MNFCLKFLKVLDKQKVAAARDAIRNFSFGSGRQFHFSSLALSSRSTTMVVLEFLAGVFTAQTNLPPGYKLGIASIVFQRGILLTGGGSAKVEIFTTCSCDCS
jgi:hypothetical protein